MRLNPQHARLLEVMGEAADFQRLLEEVRSRRRRL